MVFPFDRLILVVAAEATDREELGTELARAETHVVAPEKLKADAFSAFVLPFAKAGSFAHVIVVRAGCSARKRQRLRNVAFFKAIHFPVHPAGRDAAKRQPGRKLSAEIRAKQPVSGIFVFGHCTGTEKMPNPMLPVALTSRKWDC